MLIDIISTACRRRAAAACCLLLLTALGCGERSLSEPAVPRKTDAADDAPPPPLPIRETWDVARLGGQPAGYAHTTVSHAIEEDRKVTRIEIVQQLSFKRGADTVKAKTRVLSVETPDGKPIRFESESPLGKIAGHVRGDRLLTETVTPGKRMPSSSVWPPECAGPFALEQTLRREPLAPGQQRTIQYLEPSSGQVATLEIVAKQHEPAALLDGPVELLRVETVTRFPDGNSIAATVWTDRAGEILKSHYAAMGLEAFRTSKTVALGARDAEPGELLNAMSIRPDRPLPRPRESRRVRYRVRLKDGDPAAAFVIGPSQEVKSIDGSTAEVTVHAIRPGQEDGYRDAPADPPTADDREANNLVQSDDPQIRSEARQVAPAEKDPWKIAAALESYVFREVGKKNYSQVFSSAAEVVKNREGDCTEHAVFLAALLRARGIPARAAVGLVYLEGDPSGAFLYHMWTEAHVDGRWIPLDATLGRGGIDAGYLKLAQSNLKGASAVSCILPVAKVARNLSIAIEDAQ